MLQKLFQLLLPDFCIGCERIGTQLCRNCRRDICFIDQRHSQAQRATTHIPTIWSAVEYRDMVQALVKAVKYELFWSYTEVMAQIMLPPLKQEIIDAKIDLLVPVPLASARKKWRGFNQAESLAKHLSRQLKIPVESHALRRATARTNQARLNKEERQILQNDYQAHPTKLLQKTVCLVDDVTTTGATLEACALALRSVGVKKIYGLTFAAA